MKLKGFQIAPDAGKRRFQFMGDILCHLFLQGQALPVLRLGDNIRHLPGEPVQDKQQKTHQNQGIQEKAIVGFECQRKPFVVRKGRSDHQLLRGNPRGRIEILVAHRSAPAVQAIAASRTQGLLNLLSVAMVAQVGIGFGPVVKQHEPVRIQDGQAHGREIMRQQIVLERIFFQRHVQQRIAQCKIVILQLLVQQRDFECLFPPCLIQEKRSGKKQEQQNNAEKQLPAKLRCLHP